MVNCEPIKRPNGELSPTSGAFFIIDVRFLAFRKRALERCACYAAVFLPEMCADVHDGAGNRAAQPAVRPNATLGKQLSFGTVSTFLARIDLR